MRKSYDEIEIYNAIVNFKNINGYTPTVRELQSIVGIKSSSTAYSYLKKLERLHLISMSTGKVRTIKLCDYEEPSHGFMKELESLCERYKYNLQINNSVIQITRHS